MESPRKVVPHLEVESLVRRFGERAAVDGLSFEVGAGEVFGLLGPNGAGKSTTFHLLTGLLAPHSGRILMHGRAASPTDSRVRAEIGVIFQNPSVDVKLTGRENLELGAALYAVPGSVARGRVDEALRRAGLAARADEPVERYSGGMRRRLELARVLLAEPRLVILDEPTQGLDQTAFRKFWEDLLALRREQGLTILLTTHDPREAEHCDRIAVMDNGKVIACGTPENLRAMVGGDVLVIESEQAAELAGRIKEKLNLVSTVLGNEIRVEHPRGHELVPRIVEAFPAGSFRSVSLHRPTLADVFVNLTGRSIDMDTDGAGAKERAA